MAMLLATIFLISFGVFAIVKIVKSRQSQKRREERRKRRDADMRRRMGLER